MAAHITEHVAFQYRKEMELQLGTSLPDEDKPIPDNVEEQLSKLVAKASEKVLNNSKSEVADQQAKEAQQNPLTVLQQKEMALKEAEFAHKKEMDIAKLKVDAEQKDKDQKIEVAKVATKAISDEQKNKRDQIKQGIQEGIDLAREFVDE
jgi:post-segregation antitoxin (ccd killing protein)